MFQAFLVAVLAWINQSSNPIAWWLFREPIMVGLWIGLIYGKPVEGLMIGAAINMTFLGWISAGGANPSDIYSAGIIGTAVALQGGLTPEQSVALAIPIGVIGNYAWITWMSLNTVFPSIQDKFAEKGDYKGIMFYQVVPSQMLVWLIRSLPAFLAVYYGPPLVQGAVQALPAWAIAGLSTVGKVLPALGMAMLLKYMARKELMVFFGLGFVFSAYGVINDLMFSALVGAAIGWVYVSLQSKKSTEDNVTM